MESKVNCTIELELREDGRSAIELVGKLGDLIKLMSIAVVQLAKSANVSPLRIACDIGEKALMTQLRDELEKEKQE